jgi:hypothetical protein
VRLGPETTIEEVEETIQILPTSLVRCNKKCARTTPGFGSASDERLSDLDKWLDK